MKVVEQEPVSTFSADVDTSSYAFGRKLLNEGRFPAADAVRVEELVNYFDYNYQTPAGADPPFKPTVALFPAPWNEQKQLMLVGIKGYSTPPKERPSANLVLLVDISGSMAHQNRLPLLKRAFAMMVEQLRPEDRVAIVVYASNVGVVLPPTPVSEKEFILAAIESLQAGGSTSGGAGLKVAYEMAEKHFDPKAINRVILATDGDFNVGITSVDVLRDFIVTKRKTGIFLSVLGVGEMNYNDTMMQALAQHGNGVAAYIDSMSEARRVLVDKLSANLFPIANDVKIQVEFNPERVAEYRLIGYETRMLAREDFKNDKVDAGDLGSGHTVTALYELTMVGSPARQNDALRYAKSHAKAKKESTAPLPGDEYAFLKIRYKLPGEQSSKLIEQPINDEARFISLKKTPSDFRFAAAVAAAGQKLQNSTYLGDFSYDKIMDLGNKSKGEDPGGYRQEFLNLLKLAQTLDRR
ncbi:MAG: VWA domain-containing protein [Magnetococcales bacterium]|nr:VWA domain-containing protein [Magnetococcales bacterium]